MVQLDMIGKIVEVALADDNVRAVLMYGSFANGEGDPYSDIEFYIFLKDDATIDKRKWIAGIRPVEILFTNEFGTDVAVFDNLIRGEFHFLPISEVSVISTWQGFLDFSVRDKMKLVDKDGLIAEVFNTIQHISPEWNTADNIALVADSMINNLIFTGNVISRGEYARATHLFFYLEKYLASMIRLHCGVTGHWLDPMKGFEKEIPTYWYKRYAACIPELSESSLQQCYRRIVLLTEELFGLLDVPLPHKSVLSKLMVNQKGES